METPDFGRRAAPFIVAVPIAWAILLLFHPQGEATSVYADTQDDVTAMLVVHVGMMIFIPLIAVAIYLLLQGIDSTAARVSRIALIPFVVLYGTWEALQGIANGVLVDQVNALPEAEQAIGAELIQDFAESPLVRDFGVLGTPGSLALIVAMIAAGLALRDAGAPRWAPALFGVAGLLITAHPPPYGPIGLVLFVVAVVLVWRSQPGVTASRPEPSSA